MKRSDEEASMKATAWMAVVVCVLGLGGLRAQEGVLSGQPDEGRRVAGGKLGPGKVQGPWVDEEQAVLWRRVSGLPGLTNGPVGGESWELVERPRMRLGLKGGRGVALGSRHGVRVGRLGSAEGLVEWEVAGGRTVRARPVAVVLYEADREESVVVGRFVDRVGLGSVDGVVVYTNALEGLRGRVRLRVGENWVEQDVVLEGWLDRLPAGWQEGRTWLEVWTEWWGVEAEVRERVAVCWDGDVSAEDELVELGGWRLVSGRAFGWPEGEAGGWVPVAKEWVRGEDGRQYLVERLPLVSVKQRLERLPRVRGTGALTVRPGRWWPGVSGGHAAVGGSPGGEAVSLVAQLEERQPGLVLDWLLVGPVPLPAGCVAWWPLAGDGADVVGGHTAGVQGTVNWEAGAVGRGVGLTPSNYLSAVNAAGLNPTVGLTLEGWVNRSAGGYGVLPVICKDGPGGRQYSLVVWSNRVEGGVNLSGTGWVGVTAWGTLTADQWHHVALSWDGQRLRLYVNGQLRGDVAAAGTLVTTAQPVTLGAAPGWGWYGSGRLDECAIYNRALSASEVFGIYQAGGAGKVWPTCVAAPAGLVAWWPGDGGPWDLARTNALRLRNGLGYAAAVVGGGFLFDGADDGADAGPDSVFDVGVGEPLSVELWMRPEVNQTTYGVMSLVGKRWAPSGSTALGWELFLINGRLGVQIADAGGYANFISSGPDLRDGGWHHVVWVLDRQATDGGRLYLDGSLVMTFNPTIRPGSLANGDPVRVGVHPQSGVRGYYKGGLDEVRIYRSVLSLAQVQQLYQSGPGGVCKTDSDNDGLSDLQEGWLGTNPGSADSDGDGVGDGLEVVQGRNPLGAGAMTDPGQVQLQVWRPW